MTPFASAEFYLTENLVDQQLMLRVTFRSVDLGPAPIVELEGKWHIDREFDSSTYQWDHRNRLIHAEIRNNPNPAGDQPTREIDYTYDVAGNLFSRSERVRTEPDAPGQPAPEPVKRYLIHEGSRVLLELDDLQRLERQRTYAGAVDQLLAVEDFDFGPTPIPDEIIWPLADYQGTIKDVRGVDVATGAERFAHLYYDAFGAPKDDYASLSEDDVTDVLADRYTGMAFDFSIGLYLAEGRVYDPFSGRYQNVSMAGTGIGDTNVYRFSGNQPVNRPTCGRPAAINALQGAATQSGMEIFGSEYQKANPYWAQEAALGVAIVMAVTAPVSGPAMAALMITGAVVGGSHGALETYSYNHDATAADYFFGTAMGAVSGFAHPVGALASASGAAIGGTAEVLAGGEFFGTGFQWGGLAGGLVGDLDSAARQATRPGGRILSSAWTEQLGRAAMHEMAAPAIGSVIGAAAGWAYYEDAEGALHGANLGVFAGNIVHTGLKVRSGFLKAKPAEVANDDLLRGSYDGAARLQVRAQELFDAQTGHGNTIIVIRGRHRVNGAERRFISMQGDRQTAPRRWTLHEGEQWVPGLSRDAHAEENVLHNPALSDWDFIEGGTSRNVCWMDRCGATVRSAGMELGGPAFAGRQGTGGLKSQSQFGAADSPWNTSLGVRNPRHARGRLFNSSSASRTSW